ncbi:MAG: heavy-metal-associated domain-containing protein [Hamadaea sp.]|nr:heavy-metal-associated domain-containing protein [Hamadaea sp.]
MSVETTYKINGMTCGHCAQAVTGELTLLTGVRSVDVDVPAGTATVTSDAPLTVDDVRAAVDEAGYELAGVSA